MITTITAVIITPATTTFPTTATNSNSNSNIVLVFNFYTQPLEHLWTGSYHRLVPEKDSDWEEEGLKFMHQNAKSRELTTVPSTAGVRKIFVHP